MTASTPPTDPNESTASSERRSDERRSSERRGSSSQRKPFVAKGHDKQLEEAQNAGREVVLALMDCDTDLHAMIVRRDKFTVTVRPSMGTYAGRDLLVYKHAIAFIAL